MKKSCIALLIAFVVFIAGIGIALNVDTQSGQITVQDVSYTSNQDASLLHGRLYIPASATKSNPAPAVIFFPGNDGDTDKYSMIGVELSRRGYVAMVSDMRGQGHSIGSVAKAGPEDTYGAIEATEYMRSLSIVDKDNIILGGHSLGGLCTVWTYGVAPDDWYNGYLLFGIATRDFNKSIPSDVKLNIFLATGRDDGDAKDHTNVAEFFGNCSPEQFEPGKVYGSFDDGNARVNYQAMDAVHNSEYVNFGVIEAAVNFVQNSMPAPNPIDGSSQVWVWRYIGTTIAYFALIFMLLPLGSLLLATPFFSTICRNVPEYKGNTKKLWWVWAGVSAILPPLTYFVWTSKSVNWMPVKIFNVQRATMTLGWTLAIAAITLVIIIGGYFLRPKDKRPALENYGISYEKGQNIANIAKSLLLSVIIVLVIYAVLAVTYRWTLIDVRIWNSSFRVLTAERVLRVLKYFIPFAVAYTITAVNLHGTLRPKDGTLSPVKEILINVAIMAPLYWVWAIWFGPFSWLKQNGALPSFSGHMYSFFWALPITMTIIATVSTYFFRKTGRVFVGAFISGWLVCWTLLGGFSMLLGALPPK